MSWGFVGMILGDDVVSEIREYWNDLERFENEGGPCRP